MLDAAEDAILNAVEESISLTLVSPLTSSNGSYTFPYLIQKTYEHVKSIKHTLGQLEEAFKPHGGCHLLHDCQRMYKILLEIPHNRCIMNLAKDFYLKAYNAYHHSSVDDESTSGE